MQCRKRLTLRRQIAIVVLLLMGGCASLPAGYERTESRALEDTASTTLGRSAAELLKAHPGQSGFRPLPNGVDALLVRMVLAERAERSLDVQYYIWHDDLTGRLFANALLRAADRGVRVRILIDDVGTKANDEVVLSLDAHPNIEVRLFNPVASRAFRGLGMLADFSRVNRRMHNKSFVADNQRAVLGGRNIGDEYFDAHGGVVFSDLDVETMGPAVAEVSKAFDAYWNAPMSIPIAALAGRSGKAAGLDALRAELAAFVEAQRESPYVSGARSTMAERLAARNDGLFWGRTLLVVDDPQKVSRAPDDLDGHLLPQLGVIARQMQSELLIVSPYFVPGDAGVAWLRGLVARGVRVTVLTNSLAATDVGAVHAGYKRYREALLDGGVRLYEFKPGAIEYERARGKNRQTGSSSASLHAKTFVFDRRAVFIGSLNLDPRSSQLNTEIGVVCESEPMARALADGLLAALDQVAWRVEKSAGPAPHLVWIENTATGVVKHDEEPGVGAMRKLGVWFLGLLPIESQL
ncbi:MAG: phospholipase D family protein [Burkholderiales bacterium]|nr:phospholipase D family protein [Burkholderiales bacterium]